MARRRTATPTAEDPADFSEKIVDIDVEEEMQGVVPRVRLLGHLLPRAARRARRPQAGAAPHPLHDGRDGPAARPRPRQVRPRRRRGDGQAATRTATRRSTTPWCAWRSRSRMRLPLVDGHGNFGSLDDGPAAARYTEARLAPAALLDDRRASTRTPSTSSPTTTTSCSQPEVLPAAFPNLLVNGATGIAVGMATNMAPHNLVEVVGAARHLIAHPERDPRRPHEVRARPRPARRRQDRRPRRHPRRLRDRPRHLPDAGHRADRERSRPRRKGIVVTELPYLVGPEKVIEKIKDLRPGQEAPGHRRRQGPHRPQARPAAGHRDQERLQPRGRARAALPADADGGLLRHQQRRPRRRPAAHAGPQGAAAGLRRPPHRRRPPAQRVPPAASGAERLHLVEGLLIAILDIDEVIQVIRTSDDAARGQGPPDRRSSTCPSCRPTTSSTCRCAG